MVSCALASMLPRPRSVVNDCFRGAVPTGAVQTRRQKVADLNSIAPLYRSLLSSPETIEVMVLSAKKVGAEERVKYDASVAAGHPDPTWLNNLQNANKYRLDPATQSTFRLANAMYVNDLMARTDEAHWEGWRHPDVYTAEWFRAATRQVVEDAADAALAAAASATDAALAAADMEP